MKDTISNRAIKLIQATSLVELSKAGATDYPRWVNIKRGRARVGAEEIEILGKLYPSYRWWLLTGEECSEIDQFTPGFSSSGELLPHTQPQAKT